MDKRKNLPAPSAGHDEAKNATIVFCGDPAQVSAGFAIALQLMGIDQPAPDVEPPKKENLA